MQLTPGIVASDDYAKAQVELLRAYDARHGRAPDSSDAPYLARISANARLVVLDNPENVDLQSALDAAGIAATVLDPL